VNRWHRPATGSSFMRCSARVWKHLRCSKWILSFAAKSRAPGQAAAFQIGRHGQLQEWLEDFEEAEPNHRHTSHLIALYPENQISPYTTPELAKAAEVTIERRIQSPNWEDTEWGRANFINLLCTPIEWRRSLPASCWIALRVSRRQPADLLARGPGRRNTEHLCD